MRKIKLQMQLSLDGFVCGPNGEMDWMIPEWDDVLKNYAAGLTNSVDTFLLGRATGEGMADYWPTVASNPQSSGEEKWMAEKLNSLPKIIFSRTISQIDWNNTRIANDIIEEVKELKSEPGKDIMIYGGAEIVSSFIRENLIDEYHLFINPVVIGKGKPIFRQVKGNMNLKLVNTTPSSTGIVVLHYVPQKAKAITTILMKEKLIKGFEETTTDLLATLSSFTQEEFNEVPFEGSWTAGQVAEHLYKSESNIPRVLKGNSKATERDPFEKTIIIESIFLDFTKKLQSPEFILPSDEPKNKEHFIKAFADTRKELRNLIETMDLSQTFTDFPFPQVGEFTGWEWICFAVSHSKRHIRQMKVIAEKLREPSIVTR